MKKLMFLCNVAGAFLLLIASCTTRSDHYSSSETVSAYVPVYVSEQDMNTVTISGGQQTVQPGKIYAYGSYLFQNDVSKGVHIIDCSDRSSPQKIAFINIPLNNEVSVKGNYLYCDSYKDLLVFDIADPATPKLVNRISNAFKPVSQDYPPDFNCQFECPDPSKGIIIKWELKQVKGPRCRR